MLVQEVLQLQSGGIDMISGASNTSEAFIQSLQAALQKAQRSSVTVRVEHIMGMPVVVDVRDDDVDDDVLDRIFDWLRTVDAIFSTYKDDSEISRLNRGELALDERVAEVAGCSTSASGCARRRAATSTCAPVAATSSIRRGSSRAGRSTAPGRFSTSAGCDDVLDLRRRRHPDARLSGAGAPGASGSSTPTSVTGSPPSCGRTISPSPRRASTSAASTSSTRTRAAPPEGVLSVTITGPVLGTADAYATAAFAMGTERAALDGRAARLRGDDDPQRWDRFVHRGIPEGLTPLGDTVSLV